LFCAVCALPPLAQALRASSASTHDGTATAQRAHATQRGACRQLQGSQKVRGYITCSTTSCTICTAFLLWRFKPQIIKVRGELAHTLLALGKNIGATIRRTHKSMMLDDIGAKSESKISMRGKARAQR
jgi:hypothetical protein